MTAIVRFEHKFVGVPNEFVRDEKISSDARVLAILLASHSATFEVRQAQLMANLVWGDRRFKNAREALEDNGYLIRSRQLDANGSLVAGPWEWILTFSPTPPSVEGRGVVGTTSRGSLEEQEQEDQVEGKNEQKDQPELFHLKQDEKKVDAEKVFEDLWKDILALCPKHRKAHISKAVSRKRFLKIVNRKTDAIPATRIAHAMLWYYKDDSQTKEDGRFWKSPQYVLGDELFVTFLQKGAFTGRRAGAAPATGIWETKWRELHENRDYYHKAWKRRGEQYAANGGRFDYGWLQGHGTQYLHEEFWRYFPADDHKKLGFGTTPKEKWRWN